MGFGAPRLSQQLEGTKRGTSGRSPTSLLPTESLFCPADDQGMPTGATKNNPTPAVGDRRAGVMCLGCQHKVRLEYNALGPFILGSVGCAHPPEVLCFAACRLWHRPALPQIHPSLIHEEGLQFFIFYLNALFPHSLYPIILILAPVLLHLTQC